MPRNLEVVTTAVHPLTSRPKQKGTLLLLAIALFKLVKGAALIAAGVAAQKLMHANDVPTTIYHWLDLLRLDPENRAVRMVIRPLLEISPGELKVARFGTFAYAALLLTEGVGLCLRKKWAEYFTIIATSGLIPLELYELARGVTAAKIWVLVVNVVIVAYLVWFIRRNRHAEAAT